jgi:DNA-binding GntR family transcriptional regulator
MASAIVIDAVPRARMPAASVRKPAVRSKGSVQDQVYGRLRQALMVGHFLPGEGITLRALAAELGVSPMPVRAAILHLIAEGGFEMLPNRSVRVPVMTLSRLEELIAVRAQLEGTAAERACRRMSADELTELRAVHRKIMKLIEEKQRGQILVCNQQFHFKLYTFARSWVLMPMIETLWLRAGPFIHLAQRSPGVLFDGRHHVVLMQALEDRNPRAARRAIEHDIAMAGQNLRKASILAREATT